MIFASLFYTFFKIGLFTFGGGYAMISIIRDEVLSHGWMTEGELLNFIAVSESTPGPIAVNMATLIGSSQGGFFGSVCATLGVVLPSFFIILIISALLKNLLKYKGVQAFLQGLRPAVVGLILSVAITLFFSTLFSLKNLQSVISVDWKGCVILVLLLAVHFTYKHFKKKKPSPILMILLSAGLGILFYSFG